MKLKARFLIPAALAWLAAACSDATQPTEPTLPVDPARSAAEASLDVRDRYIVVFHERVARPGDEARQLVSAHGGTLHFTYEHAIRGFAATLSPRAVEAIRRNPSVRYVEPDGIATLAAQVTQTSAPWGLDRTDQRALPLSGTYTYQTEASGQGVNAYVVDSGIRFSHIEFGGRAVLGADYVGDGRNGNDCYGHGTQVAGVLGGNTYGVAKQVKLHSVRVFACSSTTYTSAIVAGLDWVRYNHVKPAVVNLSLTSTDNAAQDDAVKALLAAGVTVVSAAGNGGPSGVFDVCNISSAYIDGVITAGATDRNDARWIYSNIGYCMDVFAPGADITSASHLGDTNVATGSGTSFAAPHVAGAVARYLQTQPSATPAQAHAYVVNSATTGVVTNPGYLSPNRLLFVDPALGMPAVGANITGPGTITSAGTYTWQANPTGGTGSHTYTWEYRVQGGTTWSVVGTGSSYSRSVAASDASFELRVTVGSGGQAASDTHLVTVSATPLSASIDGPEYMMGGETGTWYAYASGGTGSYTYQWQYRSAGSTTWSNVGTASSYSRTAPLRTSFYLRVIVSSGGASTTSPELYVYVEPYEEPMCGKYYC